MAEGPIQIDLHAILRARLKGWKKRMVPGFLISAVERLICQNELNRILRYCWPARGHEFSEKVGECLDVRVEVEGLDSIDPSGRYVFASNHPLGGLDGIAMVGVLGAKFGDGNLRVLVNDLLMNVEPLADVFLPINKFGAQGKVAAAAINEAYASDKQIVMFPAGLVSRLGDDGRIRDLQWQKAFAAKALAFGRDIVPVWFEGLNSPRFYKLARLRKKLGIKVNLEQVMLPSELTKAHGRRFRIRFGTPMPIDDFRRRGLSAPQIAAEVRAASDSLA